MKLPHTSTLPAAVANHPAGAPAPAAGAGAGATAPFGAGSERTVSPAVLLKLGTNVPAVGSSPSHNGGTGGIAGALACTVGATGEPMIATGSGRLVAGGGAEATAAVREALAQGCSPFVRLKVWPNMASMFIPSESDRCVTACPAVTSEANRPE